jgi:hypothetical protein
MDSGARLIAIPQRLDKGPVGRERVKETYAYSVRICYGLDKDFRELVETYDIRLDQQIKQEDGKSPAEALIDHLARRGALSSIRLSSRSEALRDRKDPVARDAIALSRKVSEAEMLRRESPEGDPMGGSPGCEISQRKENPRRGS